MYDFGKDIRQIYSYIKYFFERIGELDARISDIEDEKKG
jgi:hypothetical protein